MSKQRITDIEACITSIEGVLTASKGMIAKDGGISPHQQVGAHKDILRLKGEAETLREQAIERTRSEGDADITHRLRAKEVEVLALQSKLHDAESRLADLEESLSIYRGQS